MALNSDTIQAVFPIPFWRHRMILIAIISVYFWTLEQTAVRETIQPQVSRNTADLCALLLLVAGIEPNPGPAPVQATDSSLTKTFADILGSSRTDSPSFTSFQKCLAQVSRDAQRSPGDGMNTSCPDSTTPDSMRYDPTPTSDRVLSAQTGHASMPHTDRSMDIDYIIAQARAESRMAANTDDDFYCNSDEDSYSVCAKKETLAPVEEEEASAKTPDKQPSVSDMTYDSDTENCTVPSLSGDSLDINYILAQTRLESRNAANMDDDFYINDSSTDNDDNDDQRSDAYCKMMPSQVDNGQNGLEQIKEGRRGKTEPDLKTDVNTKIDSDTQQSVQSRRTEPSPEPTGNEHGHYDTNRSENRTKVPEGEQEVSVKSPCSPNKQQPTSETDLYDSENEDCAIPSLSGDSLDINYILAQARLESRNAANMDDDFYSNDSSTDQDDDDDEDKRSDAYCEMLLSQDDNGQNGLEQVKEGHRGKTEHDLKTDVNTKIDSDTEQSVQSRRSEPSPEPTGNEHGHYDTNSSENKTKVPEGEQGVSVKSPCSPNKQQPTSETDLYDSENEDCAIPSLSGDSLDINYILAQARLESRNAANMDDDFYSNDSSTDQDDDDDEDKRSGAYCKMMPSQEDNRQNGLEQIKDGCRVMIKQDLKTDINTEIEYSDTEQSVQSRRTEPLPEHTGNGRNDTNSSENKPKATEEEDEASVKAPCSPKSRSPASEAMSYESETEDCAVPSLSGDSLDINYILAQARLESRNAANMDDDFYMNDSSTDHDDDDNADERSDAYCKMLLSQDDNGQNGLEQVKEGLRGKTEHDLKTDVNTKIDSDTEQSVQSRRSELSPEPTGNEPEPGHYDTNSSEDKTKVPEGEDEVSVKSPCSPTKKQPTSETDMYDSETEDCAIPSLSGDSLDINYILAQSRLESRNAANMDDDFYTNDSSTENDDNDDDDQRSDAYSKMMPSQEDNEQNGLGHIKDGCHVMIEQDLKTDVNAKIDSDTEQSVQSRRSEPSPEPTGNEHGHYDTNSSENKTKVPERGDEVSVKSPCSPNKQQPISETDLYDSETEDCAIPSLSGDSLDINYILAQSRLQSRNAANMDDDFYTNDSSTENDDNDDDDQRSDAYCKMMPSQEDNEQNGLGQIKDGCHVMIEQDLKTNANSKVDSDTESVQSRRTEPSPEPTGNEHGHYDTNSSENKTKVPERGDEVSVKSPCSPNKQQPTSATDLYDSETEDCAIPSLSGDSLDINYILAQSRLESRNAANMDDDFYTNDSSTDQDDDDEDDQRSDAYCKMMPSQVDKGQNGLEQIKEGCRGKTKPDLKTDCNTKIGSDTEQSEQSRRTESSPEPTANEHGHYGTNSSENKIKVPEGEDEVSVKSPCSPTKKQPTSETDMYDSETEDCAIPSLSGDSLDINYILAQSRLESRNAANMDDDFYTNDSSTDNDDNDDDDQRSDVYCKMMSSQDDNGQNGLGQITDDCRVMIEQDLKTDVNTKIEYSDTEQFVQSRPMETSSESTENGHGQNDTIRSENKVKAPKGEHEASVKTPHSFSKQPPASEAMTYDSDTEDRAVPSLSGDSLDINYILAQARLESRNAANMDDDFYSNASSTDQDDEDDDDQRQYMKPNKVVKFIDENEGNRHQDSRINRAVTPFIFGENNDMPSQTVQSRSIKPLPVPIGNGQGETNTGSFENKTKTSEGSDEASVKAPLCQKKQPPASENMSEKATDDEEASAKITCSPDKQPPASCMSYDGDTDDCVVPSLSGDSLDINYILAQTRQESRNAANMDDDFYSNDSSTDQDDDDDDDQRQYLKPKKVVNFIDNNDGNGGNRHQDTRIKRAVTPFILSENFDPIVQSSFKEPSPKSIGNDHGETNTSSFENKTMSLKRKDEASAKASLSPKRQPSASETMSKKRPDEEGEASANTLCSPDKQPSVSDMSYDSETEDCAVPSLSGDSMDINYILAQARLESRNAANMDDDFYTNDSSTDQDDDDDDDQRTNAKPRKFVKIAGGSDGNDDNRHQDRRLNRAVTPYIPSEILDTPDQTVQAGNTKTSPKPIGNGHGQNGTISAKSETDAFEDTVSASLLCSPDKQLPASDMPYDSDTENCAIPSPSGDSLDINYILAQARLESRNAANMDDDFYTNDSSTDQDDDDDDDQRSDTYCKKMLSRDDNRHDNCEQMKEGSQTKKEPALKTDVNTKIEYSETEQYVQSRRTEPSPEPTGNGLGLNDTNSKYEKEFPTNKKEVNHHKNETECDVHKHEIPDTSGQLSTRFRYMIEDWTNKPQQRTTLTLTEQIRSESRVNSFAQQSVDIRCSAQTSSVIHSCKQPKDGQPAAVRSRGDNNSNLGNMYPSKTCYTPAVHCYQTRSLTVAKFRAKFNRTCMLLPDTELGQSDEYASRSYSYTMAHIEHRAEITSKDRQRLDQLQTYRAELEEINKAVGVLLGIKEAAESHDSFNVKHHDLCNTTQNSEKKIEQSHYHSSLNSTMTPTANVTPHVPLGPKPAFVRKNRRNFKQLSQDEQMMMRYKIENKEILVPQAPAKPKHDNPQKKEYTRRIFK